MTRHSLTRAAAALAFALALALPAFAQRLAQDAAPRPDSRLRLSEGPRGTEDADARKAEEFCEGADALSKQGDARGALEASAESVKLYRSVYLASRMTMPPPGSSEGLADLRSAMAARLRRAPECIDLHKRLGGDRGATDFERAQLEALRAHAVGFVETDLARAVFFSRETDERAEISYKPEPRFPRGARGTIVSVVVRVRAILGADGEVRHAVVMTRSPSIFGESSVEAAKGVKFKPAEKGGRRVSQFVTLEYGFRSY